MSQSILVSRCELGSQDSVMSLAVRRCPARAGRFLSVKKASRHQILRSLSLSAPVATGAASEAEVPSLRRHSSRHSSRHRPPSRPAAQAAATRSRLALLLDRIWCWTFAALTILLAVSLG